MNRFIIGGVLAGIVLMLMSGLSRLQGDRPERGQLASQQNTTAQDADGLGALPLEQAGQLVQRQSEVGTGIEARATVRSPTRATIALPFRRITRGPRGQREPTASPLPPAT